MYGSQELQRFLEDSVSENEASTVEAWLDQEPNRWDRLEELTNDQALVNRLRNSLPSVIYRDEPEFQRVMAEASTALGSDCPTISQVVGGVPAEIDHIELQGYRVIRQLGRGGMGTVYEAEHELMQKRVAVKVMSRRYLEDSTALERFMSEMILVGRLNHPNLVRGLDARRESGRLYLIMEYLEAENLAAYRKRRGTLPTHECCDIICQAALGLADAHKQGIIHRDIKPLNLMITHDGVVKVLDLGLARLESGQTSTHLTNDRMIVGSPDYISPEQVQAPRTVDARADIYSLGCTLFFLLTGRSPFHHRREALTKVMAHVNEPFSLPAAIRANLPETLLEILQKLTEKDRNLRFQTAQEVVDALVPFRQPVGTELVAVPKSNSSTPTKSQSARSTEMKVDPQRIAVVESGRHRAFGKPLVAFGVIVALASFFAFAITLFIKTNDGLVQLEFADGSPLAGIDVGKDHTITIEDPIDQKAIQITIDRESQSLRLSKDGFEILTKGFQLNVDGQKIQVEFTPVTSSPLEPSIVAGSSVVRLPADDQATLTGVATSHGGGWRIDQDEVIQTVKQVPGQLLVFGDVNWKEYDFSFEGRVPNQERVHGFSGMFKLTSPNDYLAFGIGIYYNQGHEVSRSVGGKWHRARGMYSKGKIAPEQWQNVRIEVRGETARCFLNDELLFVNQEPLFESGRCGLATYDTLARFRNLLVQAPDGVVLWKGPPTSINEGAPR